MIDLDDAEKRAGHVASPEGATLIRELVAEVRRLRDRAQRTRAPACKHCAALSVSEPCAYHGCNAARCNCAPVE